MSDPRTPEEVQQMIADAFNSSPNNLMYEQTRGESDTTKMFLLKDLMYYNLQKYLYMGIDLPPTVEAFKARYDRTNLGALDVIDASAYDDLQVGFVNIQNHCASFSLNSMSKFGTVSTNITLYCDHVSRYLTGKGLVLDSLNIMLDSASTPQQFDTARTNIKTCMKMLAKEAGARAAECDDLVKDLEVFRVQTVADADLVNYLNHQFNIGDPVYKSKSDRSPAANQETYSARLSDEIGRLNKEVSDLQNKISDEEEERQHDIVVAGTAATYIWLGPAGLIAGATVMGVYGSRAEELKGEIEANQAKLSTDLQQAKALQKTIEMVQALRSVVKSLDDTIKKAIDAVNGMSKSFTKQQTDLADTQVQWDQVHEGADGDPDEMIITMKAAVDTAIVEWAELKILALDFINNSKVTFTVSPS